MSLSASRVAFVSDIHGNLPAFEAVLARLDSLGPFDAVVGGGDYSTCGAYPAECVQRLRSLPWQCVRGNGDEVVVTIATDGRIPLRDFPPGEDHGELYGGRLEWAARRLDEAEIEFLASLPLSWECAGPSGQTLKFVHATPWSTHPIVVSDAPEPAKRELVERGGADVLLYAHIHFPYIQHIDGKLLASIGSVGAPFDGDTRSCFAIATDDGDGWHVEHVRVAYDVEGHARAVEESGMPESDAIAAGLRSARPPGAHAHTASDAQTQAIDATTEEQK